MDHDAEPTWDEIKSAMITGLAVQGSIHRGLVAAIESLPEDSRAGYDAAIRGQDFDGGVSQFTAWFENLARREPVPERDDAYSFGLIETAGGSGGGRELTMYVCAWQGFDPSEFSYGCPGSDWYPEENWVGHGSLQRVFERDHQESTHYIELIATVVAGRLAAEVLSRADPKLTLGSRTSRELVCGFDAGEFLHVGTLTRDRFVRSGLEGRLG